MIGLKSEKDRNDINSAESLRNIILLFTDRVSTELLLEDIKNAPAKSKMPSNVFAYSENQPRVPKGNPDGGQWTDEGKSSGSSKSDSDNKTEKCKNIKVVYSKTDRDSSKDFQYSDKIWY